MITKNEKKTLVRKKSGNLFPEYSPHILLCVPPGYWNCRTGISSQNSKFCRISANRQHLYMQVRSSCSRRISPKSWSWSGWMFSNRNYQPCDFLVNRSIFLSTQRRVDRKIDLLTKKSIKSCGVYEWRLNGVCATMWLCQDIPWLGMRLARRWTCVFLWIAIVFRSSVRGAWPDEPLHGGCSRLQADMTEHLQPHFLVQYNGVFTTMWLHLNRVLEK